MTKLSVMAAAAALLLAAPFADADQKLDQAVAKAEEQIQKGKPEEALKGMQKFADNANSGEGFLALARIQEKAGDVEAAPRPRPAAPYPPRSATPASRPRPWPRWRTTICSAARARTPMPTPRRP